jgi:hypothetical protein
MRFAAEESSDVDDQRDHPVAEDVVSLPRDMGTSAILGGLGGLFEGEAVRGVLGRQSQAPKSVTVRMTRPLEDRQTIDVRGPRLPAGTGSTSALATGRPVIDTGEPGWWANVTVTLATPSGMIPLRGRSSGPP